MKKLSNKKSADMQACLKYFTSRSVYKKVFKKIWKKYESLSRMGGSVRISNLTHDEKEQLGGFLQKDYSSTEVVSISCSMMEKALKESKFSAITFKELLEEYYDNELIGNKEKKAAEKEKKKQLFQKVKELTDDEKIKEWLDELDVKKNKIYISMINLLIENEIDVLKRVKNVFKAILNFPSLNNSIMMLPVFAASITGDPHTFDIGNFEQQLFCDFLRFYYKDDLEMTGTETEKIGELFYKAGILRDELWNFVTIYGFDGIKQDGTLHAGIKGFCNEKEAIILSLQTLGKLKEVIPANDTIYMVENPAIFTYLCKKYPDNAFICGNGQIRLAVWVLIDKIKKNASIMYAGDFDPEGLLIAQRLKHRYPDRIKYWKYTKELYTKYISNKVISNESIKKLDKIEDEELIQVKNEMKICGMATYQETMLDEYICTKN